MQVDIEGILPRLRRPSRYLGTEFNSIHKDWAETSVRMAFIFPDLYEIGMSHLGLMILYGLVNERPQWLMERVFVPDTDLEKILREEDLALFSLESRHALADFDVIGFTLPYELTYPNILNVLDLGQVPLASSRRTTAHPLVIAGGPAAANPEPLAPYLDAVVLGDGEEVLLEILEVVQEWKEDGRQCREELLTRLAGVAGVYLPAFYDVSYLPDGRVAAVEPNRSGAPRRVVRRVLKDFEHTYFPSRPIVPFGEVVHDRLMLEVMRGCTRGCRFCQAGTFYRPVRERSPQVLRDQAETLLRTTGHEEMALVSLSTADYSSVQALCRDLVAAYAGEKVNLSLPSLRVDRFSVELAELVSKVRRAGITLAPEAGTQRLRDVINKGVTEDDFRDAVRAAWEYGWQRIKLYFMIGLPTETEEDLEGIVGLCREALDIGRGYRRRPQVHVSIASFVPKPHTPFQWEPQEAVDRLEEKQRYLKKHLPRQVEFSWHDAQVSFLEAVLARGDRRLAAVLEHAWSRGSRLDSWPEHFNYRRWREAFVACGLDPTFYANRPRSYDEVLPWDHLDLGITRHYLRREHRRARAGELTPDCRLTDCTGCGICPRLGVELEIHDQTAY